MFRADVLGVIGQVGAGIGDMARALELDTLNSVFNTYYGGALSAAKLYDEGIRYQRRALDLAEKPRAGPHWEIADAYRDKADQDKAAGNAHRANAEYDSAIAEYQQSRHYRAPRPRESWQGLRTSSADRPARGALKTLDEIRNRPSNYRWVNLAVVPRTRATGQRFCHARLGNLSKRFHDDGTDAW
jgi:tetratricopeptide (TPR) repeat protein